MVRIKWLPDALEDFQRLYDFLYSKDTDAAARAASDILQASHILKTSPRIGRPMTESENRELFIAFGAGAYVIRYRLEDKNAVVVIRVWHSKENRTT